MADGEPSAAELAAMAAELAELRLMCEDPQILRLPAALRRANLQSWRCTLHRDRLVSALALAHKISPPRGTLEAQLAFVRARLRAHAVFLACSAPFGAWAQFARRSTRELFKCDSIVVPRLYSPETRVESDRVSAGALQQHRTF